MAAYDLESFLKDCEEICSKEKRPSSIVLAVSPLLKKLLLADLSFLNKKHFKADKNQYARHLVYCNEDESLSLFTMVWSPGQWTPIHDHATWGVVGIVEGTLEEQSFIREDRDNKIHLEHAGNVLLSKNSVISFVPNPDHIHQTGVSSESDTTISLHLYGRSLNDYYKYDLEKGTREKVKLS